MNDRLEQVRQWLRYAKTDLQLAEGALQQEIGAPWQWCFHAQQAAEKALKAALIFEALTVPRSHDLTELAGELPAAWTVALDEPALKILTEWAVEPRYPGDLPDATLGDARRAVRDARATYDAVLQGLAVRGFDVTVEFS